MSDSSAHRFSCILAMLALFASLVAFPARAAAQSRTKTTRAPAAAVPPAYKGAIVMNAAGGQVLFEDNADSAAPPASITKLMTFLVVHDAIKAGRINPDTPVAVTSEDARIGGTRVRLKQGEVFTVDELLHALMIQSANDCAHALAHAAASGREEFVALMNARAQSLGMKNTTFRTPHGLPPPSRRDADGDLTTPRDIALLSLALIRETDILKYTSIRLREFGARTRPDPVMMKNHNNLLAKIAGVDGLKTGFTRNAGYCLAATAHRDGNRLIIVTLGSPDSKTRDLKIAALFEHYFAELPSSPISAAPVTAAPPPPSSPRPAAPPPSAPGNSTAPPPRSEPALNPDGPDIRF
ncbi:MAG: D-alanyl-D-alanine carboxypeptidase [Opitutaceae bacterium]|jgi:D-alanyl-D-alanine carboxypeptidase (penicillin-binding protein 5/6)|nr:D-alanyl-D-alanine carboxypeptidase [Opitutaceae bacterium]